MKVSVCMITYNHERFIAQAVRSALEQTTNFDYEIVVGDDCSDDRTSAILQQLSREHPGRIRVSRQNRNLGITANLASTLRDCRGEYVALLEGDDYWTSPNKLQCQVDLLDQRPDCAICFHQVRVIDEQGTARNVTPGLAQKRLFGLEQLLSGGNVLPTCSVMFRNQRPYDFPDWYFTLRIGDFPLHVFNARRGRILFIPVIMGVYRKHAGGVFSAERNSVKVREIVRMYDLLNQHLNYEYAGAIAAAQEFWKAVEHFRAGETAEARRHAALRARRAPFNKQWITAVVLAYASPLYAAVRSLRPIS